MKEKNKDLMWGCGFLLVIAGVMPFAVYGVITFIKEIIALL